MPDMTEIVNGHTANLHADFAGVNRFKNFFFASEGIEKF